MNDGFRDIGEAWASACWGRARDASLLAARLVSWPARALARVCAAVERRVTGWPMLPLWQVGALGAAWPLLAAAIVAAILMTRGRG